MRCPSCHHDNRPDRRFCTQCGGKLPMRCSSCGASIEVGEKFCGGCGAAVTIGSRTTTPSSAHAPLLADKIRRAKVTIEGERKQVTVLFVDVKGSMELAERLDPEAWSQIMQRFFRILCDSVERFVMAFDCLCADGSDFREQALGVRRDQLNELLDSKDVLPPPRRLADDGLKA